jgi:hypothetical protein
LPNGARVILHGEEAAQQQLPAETQAAAPQESQVEELVEALPASTTASVATVEKKSLLNMS